MPNSPSIPGPGAASHISRSFSILASIILLAWLAGPALAASVDRSVIGRWKLSAVLDSSEITAISDLQAQKLLGQVLYIGADKVVLGKRICKNPSFEVTKAETNSYFANSAHVSAAKLGLPNPVTAVHINCTYVYKKAPNRMIVHWKGYFFDARRLAPEQMPRQH